MKIRAFICNGLKVGRHDPRKASDNGTALTRRIPIGRSPLSRSHLSGPLARRHWGLSGGARHLRVVDVK